MYNIFNEIMKICITGKPCSGKSLVMEYIAKAGYRTFIADEFVHAIYKKNQIGYNLIKSEFGSKYVTNNEVNRKELGALVFNDKNALKKLNNLINPLIKNAILELDKKQDWFIELATYLYYPKSFDKIFDKIVLIFRQQNLKNNVQNTRFSYLKKIPTIFVENSKKIPGAILYIGNGLKKKSSIDVDIFVNNSDSKINLKKNILSICKKLI